MTGDRALGADVSGYKLFPMRLGTRTAQISVYAGTAFEGYSGDRGPATSAKIDACGIALDHAGNLHLADKVHNRIRRVDARSGIITTVAGNGHPRRQTAK